MKTPISYYGGKQNLINTILPLFPNHKLYAEPFVGGGAIFWAKKKSEVEVINDTNRELINFYEVCQNDFVALEKLIRISLHSRSLHKDATVVNDNPHMFTREKRAWAVWILATQSFASMLDGSWGYDKCKGTTSRKINNKRADFTEKYAIRLQNVQIECTDALRIINSRDYEDAFFYCDPPYYNSDCGHYDGYSIEDFENLLKLLSNIEGKFLLSSYPSEILKKYVDENGWYQKEIHQSVSSTTHKPMIPSIIARWSFVKEGDQNLKYADALYRNKSTLNAFFSTCILYDNVVPGTLTSSGESVYYSEVRNLNDTEYRRMSSFPSDYDFCGRDARYVCGMSVPPFMMGRIASEIKRQWF